MKFSLALLSTIATVLAAEYDLTLSSEDAELNNKGLVGWHEGAGINYLTVGGSPFHTSYDEEKKIFNSDAMGNIKTTLSVNEGNFLQDSVTGPGEFDITDDHVVYKGSDKFYACKNVNDIYNYSAKTYLIMSSNSVGDCKEVNIVAKKSEDAPPSSSVVPSPWTNVTTTQVTITDYTTFCPNPTTITITTCTQDRCAPHPITVTEPGTVTVTGECVFPSTPAPAPAPTTTVKTTPTTVAEQSTTEAPAAPSVIQSENAVGRNAANYGAAALAIAAAALM